MSDKAKPRFWQCGCIEHGGVVAADGHFVRELQADIERLKSELVELRAVLEIIKEVDARFGHFRELKGLNESGPSEALADMADIIHKAAQTAGANDG